MDFNKECIHLPGYHVKYQTSPIDGVYMYVCVLELRDQIGDPIMIGRFLDFFPTISDPRFLSARSGIGRFFFVCSLFMRNTSKFLQINST